MKSPSTLPVPPAPGSSLLPRLAHAAATGLGALLLVLAPRCGGWGGYSSPTLPQPTIVSFTAAKDPITVGDATTLTAVFGDGLGEIDPNVGPVISNVPVPISPTKDTTYTLTVAAAGGSFTTGTQTVTVVPQTVLPVITGPAAALAVADATGLTASVPSQDTPENPCDYQWTITNGTITGGQGTPTVTFTDAAYGQLSLSCTVTNAAGMAMTSQTPFTAQLGGPTLISFQASPVAVIGGAAPGAVIGGVTTPASITLAYDFTNQINANNSNGTPSATITAPAAGSLPALNEPISPATGASGTLTVPVPTATTTYTLTVSDGSEVGSLSTRVSVVDAPAITGFTAFPAIIGPNGGSSLTADFDAGGGTAVVSTASDANVGTLTNGTPLPVGPLAANTVYTLTVTNLAGATATKTVEVLVGNLSLLAGAPSGEGSRDGQATGAHFQSPGGIVVDSAGNVFLADTDASTLRKVTASGATSTFAGLEGVAGYADGQGDQAASARFNHPVGLAIDSNNNLYVADAGNNAIRRVAPSGDVTTLAGTAGHTGFADDPDAAGSATFDNPQGIAVTPDGTRVFVADTGNSLLRMLTVPSGGGIAAVQTIAGGGQDPSNPGQAPKAGYLEGQGTLASFSSPTGLVFSQSGSCLFVADTQNSVIRRVSVNSPYAVSSYVGSPTAASPYLHPRALALDGPGNLYVADTGNNLIQVVNPNGTTGTPAGPLPGVPPVGQSDALLNPGGVAVGLDSSGNVTSFFISDTGNQIVRQVTPPPAGSASAPTETTLAGQMRQWGYVNAAGGAARMFHPAGAALDPQGNLIVADSANNVIRSITTTATTSTSGGVTTTLPAGTVTLLAGVQGPGAWADGLAIPPAPGGGTPAQFNTPTAVAVDSNGTIYVADTGNQVIRMISNGQVTTLAGTHGTAGSSDFDPGNGPAPGGTFSNPSGLALDGNGNLWVADTGNNLIRMITLSNGAVTTMAGTLNTTGSENTTAPGTATSFNAPTGLAATGSGNGTLVYVADTGNHLVRVISFQPQPGNPIQASNLQLNTLAGTATVAGYQDGVGTAATLDSPVAITLNATGDLFVANNGSSTLVQITPQDGLVTTLIGSGLISGNEPGGLPALISPPWGLVVNPAGTLSELFLTVDDAVMQVSF